jgi:signal transduction histidine kinase/CheY-like chemotaxis protein
MSFPLASLRIQYEHDVVSARQRTREVAELLSFDTQQQTRLATAVSEIARNALSYGGGGKAEFVVEGSTSPQLFSIVVSDAGPGISNLDEILEGRYRSATGMGLGIIGAQRLMDRFNIESSPGNGTVVMLGKLLPRRGTLVTEGSLPEFVARLARQKPRDLLDEFREQNRELLRTLDELRKRQDELISLNRELEDTNRGVVALYAELDEKADHLRRADEVKSRFLSNMSHEFRTPLNSILALSRMLLQRTDGDLTAEQQTQVGYIRQSADSLCELVNDLLDLAKVEAGKIVIHPIEFEVEKLFGALRGMLRPLLAGTSVNLVFEEPVDIPTVYSDEGKVSQILRNFISNALKFTEIGEVRVSAHYHRDSEMISFRVKDTGIGIAPQDSEIIFQEFTQVDSAIQRKVKGTGLGLPLSRKLSELLGGSAAVESEIGVGSTFSFRMPKVYAQPDSGRPTAAEVVLEPSRLPVLLVEDHYETRLVYEKALRSSPWQIISAPSVWEAENVLRNIRPVAIVLDIMLRGEDAWELLAKLKSARATRTIPILVATTVDDRAKALALGADAYAMKPVSPEALSEQLAAWTGKRSSKTVLLVDDQDVSRYLSKQVFNNPEILFLEASNGLDGLKKARLNKPDLIIMDLSMPEMNGFEAIEGIHADPLLRDIPVIVATSKILSPDEVRRLAGRVLAVLPKDSLSDSRVSENLRALLAPAGLADLLGERPVQQLQSGGAS